MNKEEALRLLDQVAANVNMSREAHVKVQQAVNVLAEAIKPESIKSK